MFKWLKRLLGLPEASQVVKEDKAIPIMIQMVATCDKRTAVPARQELSPMEAMRERMSRELEKDKRAMKDWLANIAALKELEQRQNVVKARAALRVVA